ncbi:MAG: hypothetical protein U0841_10805 [Chloroflexia bacterium]
MATTRIKVSFDAEVAQEARQVAGQRGLSRLVNEAVRRHLQAIRLREAAEELAVRSGPNFEEPEKQVAETG